MRIRGFLFIIGVFFHCIYSVANPCRPYSEEKKPSASTYEEILEAATPLPKNLGDLEGRVNTLVLKDFVERGEITASFPPRYFKNENVDQHLQIGVDSYRSLYRFDLKTIEMEHVSTVIPTDPLSSGTQSLLVYAKGKDGQVYLLKRNFDRGAHQKELRNATRLVGLGLMPRGTGRTIVNGKTYLAVPLVGGRVVVNTFKDVIRNLSIDSLRDLETILDRLFEFGITNPEAINEMDLIVTELGSLLLIDAGYLELSPRKTHVGINTLNASDPSYAAYTEKRFEVLMSMSPAPVMIWDRPLSFLSSGVVVVGQERGFHNPGLFYLEHILKPALFSRSMDEAWIVTPEAPKNSRLGAWHGLVHKIYHAEGNSPMLQSLKKYAEENIEEANSFFEKGYLDRD